MLRYSKWAGVVVGDHQWPLLTIDTSAQNGTLLYNLGNFVHRISSKSSHLLVCNWCSGQRSCRGGGRPFSFVATSSCQSHRPIWWTCKQPNINIWMSDNTSPLGGEGCQVCHHLSFPLTSLPEVARQWSLVKGKSAFFPGCKVFYSLHLSCMRVLINLVIDFDPITVCKMCLNLLQQLGWSCWTVFCIRALGTWFGCVGIYRVGFASFFRRRGVEQGAVQYILDYTRPLLILPEGERG